MRVIIVSRIFWPEPSAASFMLEAIAREFRDQGHEVVVLTTDYRANSATISGITIKRAPVLRDNSGYVRGYLQYLSFDVPLAFRLLFGRRADVYFVEPPPTTGAVVRVILSLLGRPYFYDAADVWSDAAKMTTSSTAVLGILRWVELFAMKGAAHVFTISTGVLERMRELGVESPTTVVGFGVDGNVFRYQSPSPASSPFFVYAGSYSEWHGADIFLHAYAEFVRDHPDYRLVIVGNGSERDLLERTCAALELNSVEFWDPIGGEELNAVFADATASLASLKPGQGYDYAFTTKVYSSIASGCPVVFAGVGPTVAFIENASSTHPIGSACPYEAAAVAVALDAAATAAPSAQERRALSEWARESFALSKIAAVVERTAANVVGRR